MWAIHIFKDHALLALKNRKFDNCLEVQPISSDEIFNIKYVLYKGRAIKVYVPVPMDCEVDEIYES